MKIRTRFFLSHLSVAGVAFIIISSISYIHSKEEIIRSFRSEVDLSLDTFAGEWNGLLQREAMVLKSTAKAASGTQKGKIDRLFLKSHIVDRNLYDIYAGYPDGTYVDGNGWVPPAGFDCRERPWYKSAISNDELSYSDPYEDAETKKLTVSLSIPIKDSEGHFVGVIAGDIFLDTLSEEIKRMNFRGSGFGFISDRKGSILAHPEKDKISQKLSFFPEFKELYEKIGSDKNGRDILEIKGEKYVVSFKELPEPGWTIALAVPYSSLFHPLYELRTEAALVSCIIIIMVLISGHIFSNRLTERVCLAADYANIISGGCLVIEIPDEYLNKKDETGFLFRSIHKMAGNLMTMVNDIKEKASEMQAINEKLNITLSEKQELLKIIHDRFMLTVQVLSNTLESSDPYTRGHCDRVTSYALSMANKMGLSEEEMTDLEIAARLHDIGKVGVPKMILWKNGKLDEQELGIMSKHPQTGFKILQEISRMERARKIILQHHERYDGKGYPGGIRAESIDILARILSIADAYDAMTSKRPYRNRPLTKNEAVAELEKNAGKQFDMDVVRSFVEILAEYDKYMLNNN